MSGQESDVNRIVVRNVKIFDGFSDSISGPSDVVIEGSRISAISSNPVGDTPGLSTLVIDGSGRFLMPGMTDAHVHLMGNANNYLDFVMGATGILFGNTIAEARRMLLRGFTTVRDMGGDTAPVKTLIDKGEFEGPRIYPSQAMISQTWGTATSRSSMKHPMSSTAVRVARIRSVSPGLPTA